MIDAITSWISSKPKKKQHSSRVDTTPSSQTHARRDDRDRRPTYTKIFRWPVPAEAANPPSSVEVVGSFSNWQRVPLSFDISTQTWVAFVRDIEGNRTHHYVYLVDGKPACDEHSDGLARPSGPQEARWQIETKNGPRVMLLFGQTK